MNRFSPYAAVILRIVVGLIFLHHGIMKVHMGLTGVAGFFHGAGIPFATIFAGVVIAFETVGAGLLVLGIVPRIVAAGYVVEMTVAILVVLVPAHQPFELEGVLWAASIALVALGSGPLSLGQMLKKA